MPPTVERRLSLATSVAVASTFACNALAQQPIDFNREIRPILSNKCYACHGPDEGKREAGLRLDDAKIATSKLESGAVAIVPNNPEASELIRRVASSDVDERMPPAKFGKPLSKDEITALRKWIEQVAFRNPLVVCKAGRASIRQPHLKHGEIGRGMRSIVSRSRRWWHTGCIRRRRRTVLD